jgi:hypothetical protein
MEDLSNEVAEINIDELVDKQDNTDKFIICHEDIDVDKLNYIIINKQKFQSLLKQRVDNEDTKHIDAFVLAEKFLKKSRKGIVDVKYTQKEGSGRYYANNSLSLQCLKREIRQTIAVNYVDIDVNNAGPTILKYICDRNKIKCSTLTKYCSNRDKFFKDNNITKELGKQLFIAIMNGGKITSKLCKDLKQFMDDEVENIHARITTKYSTAYDKFKKKRMKDPKHKDNHKAAFVSRIIFDIENKILETMYDYFERPASAVLCFDGLMLKNDKKYNLTTCQKYIRDMLGIDIVLKRKPFDDAFDLSKCKIPKYTEFSLEYYPDFMNLANKEIDLKLAEEWLRNTVAFIENRGKLIILTKNKEINSTSREETIVHIPMNTQDVYKSLKIRCSIINPDYDHKFYEKHNKDKKRDLPQGHEIKMKYYLYTTMRDFFIDYETRRDIPPLSPAISYITAQFHPFLERNGVPNLTGSFNTFTGFPMERIELKEEIDFTKSKFYAHIRDGLVNGDKKEFNHFLDFVSDMIQDPAHIKGTAHIFSTRQGMGKGLLATFLKRLLGSNNVIIFNNADTYFNKFNLNQVSKILKIIEEVKDKGTAHDNHDRLKADITKDTDIVEPKNVDSFEINNCSRIMINSNNINPVRIEPDDRRFTYHRANNEHANNSKHFAPIVKEKEIENEQFCKNAFEFFANRKYKLDNVRKCYNNKYKTEQKLMNMCTGLRFIKDIIENNFHGIPMDEYKIKSIVLDAKYKMWCINKGSTYNANALKTQLKHVDIDSKTRRYFGTSTHCYYIDEKQVLKSFRSYLHAPEFEFDKADPEPNNQVKIDLDDTDDTKQPYRVESDSDDKTDNDDDTKTDNDDDTKTEVFSDDDSDSEVPHKRIIKNTTKKQTHKQSSSVKKTTRKSTRKQSSSVKKTTRKSTHKKSKISVKQNTQPTRKHSSSVKKTTRKQTKVHTKRKTHN